MFHGPGDLRLEEVPRPEPAPGDVLVQVEVALTDGTDAKTFRRGHPLLLDEVPSPFGHEFCGVDVATGRASWPRTRRRAVRAPPAPAAEETLCENLRPFLNGAYAEFLLVPERIARVNLLPVPDGSRPRSPRWSSRSRAACTASSARACAPATPSRSSAPARSG